MNMVRYLNRFKGSGRGGAGGGDVIATLTVLEAGW